GELIADCPDKAARRGRSLRQRFDEGKRVGELGASDLFALVGLDPGQDVGHVTLLDRWRRRPGALPAPAPRRCRATCCRAPRLRASSWRGPPRSAPPRRSTAL